MSDVTGVFMHIERVRIGEWERFISMPDPFTMSQLD